MANDDGKALEAIIQELTELKTKISELEKIKVAVLPMKVVAEKIITLPNGVVVTVQKRSGLFGGKRTPSYVLDHETNKVYPSRASVGKVLGGILLGNTTNFAWYHLRTAFPDRFEELPDGWENQPPAKLADEKPVEPASEVEPAEPVTV